MTPAPAKSSAKAVRDRMAAAGASSRSAIPQPAASPPPAATGRKVKYTLELGQLDEQTISDFVYHARRDLGIVIGKSDVYRALLALLRDDKALAGRVSDYIHAAKSQQP